MKTLSLFLCLLSLLFCKESTENPEFNPDSHVEIAFSTDPISLDPIHSTDLTSEKLVRFLHSTLFRLDENGNPVPYVAESYKWKPRSRELHIQLKNFLTKTKTSDPPENLAKKVVDSLNHLFNTPGPRKDNYQVFEKASQGKSPTDIILYIKSNSPKYPPDHYLHLLALSPSAIRGNTGPYQLLNWSKGNTIELRRSESDWNPDWKHLPETIRIRIIPQSTSAVYLFSKGELDSLKLADFLLTHNLTKTNKIVQKKGRSVQYVAINHKNPCLDQKFREAVNLAIDRKKIINRILEDQAELTYASIPISRLSHWNSTHLLPTFDPPMARYLLTQSKCYPEILEKELEFRMRGDDENQSKGKAVVEYLKRIGLKIKILGMEKAPLYKENGEGKGDLTFLTWYADYESPSAFLDPLFHSQKTGNGGNRSFYTNNKMDEYIQNKSIRPAVKLLIRDKPWIFLWSIQENYLISERLKKFPQLLEYL